jgi:hypothetical protein
VGNARHGLSLAIRDKVAGKLLANQRQFVHDVETASLELENGALLQGAEATLSDCRILNLRVLVDQLLDVVCFFDFNLVDQMAKLD